MENLWWMRSFPQPSSPSLKNRRRDDVETRIEEVERFKDHGGQTIVDPTRFTSGRDPHAYQKISRRTGLNIIIGAGYFFETTHPPDMDAKTAESIADEIVSEIEDGIGNTNVRPGVIKIGASHPFSDHENEQKSFRGAAIAQQQTGVPITIHPPYFYKEVHELLDVLEDAGANLNNVIVGHLDGTIREDDSLEYHASIGDRGVFLEFDAFGTTGYRPMFDKSWPIDEDRVIQIRNLFQEGYEDQILVSQDIFRKTELTKYGGYGYDYILRDIVPLFKKRGLSETDVDNILTTNPASALSLS